MAPVKDFPRKLFYKINEVASIVGVESYVLRYWETKFTMLKPERHGADERRYRQQDIDLLFRIRTLLYDEKFTIAGAVEQMKINPKGDVEVQPEFVAEASEPMAQIVEVKAEEEVTAEEHAQLSLFPSNNEEVLNGVRERLALIKAEAVSLKATLEEHIDKTQAMASG